MRRRRQSRPATPEQLAQRRRVVTHCPRGHEYTAANSYIRPDGSRTCRRCNAERSKRDFRERLYGMAVEQYAALAATQDFVCAICGRSEDDAALAVDHDHDTGTVRGLLCGPCNSGVGSFRDSAALLRAAAAYLDREPPVLVQPPTRPASVCTECGRPLDARRGRYLNGRLAWLCPDCLRQVSGVAGLDNSSGPA